MSFHKMKGKSANKEKGEDYLAAQKMKSCSAVGEENLLVAVLAAGPELRQRCAGVDLDRS